MAAYLGLFYVNKKNNFCLNCHFGSYQGRKKKFHEYINSFNGCWILLFHLCSLTSLCCYVSKNAPLPLKSVYNFREEAGNCCLTLKYSNTMWRHMTGSTLTEICWRSLLPDLMKSSNVKCLLHELLFTGCDYVTVSIIALCIGCEEKEKSRCCWIM